MNDNEVIRYEKFCQFKAEIRWKNAFWAHGGVLFDGSAVASTNYRDDNPRGSSNGHGFGSQMIDEQPELSFGLRIVLYTTENGPNLLQFNIDGNGSENSLIIKNVCHRYQSHDVDQTQKSSDFDIVFGSVFPRSHV